jgi:hypothetical protein
MCYNPHTNRLVHKVLLQVLRVCTNVVQVSRIVAQGVGARVNGWHKGQGLMVGTRVKGQGVKGWCKG